MSSSFYLSMSLGQFRGGGGGGGVEKLQNKGEPLPFFRFGLIFFVLFFVNLNI